MGDVVGPTAADFLRRRLPGFRQEMGCDLVIVNGENAAAHNGIDREGAEVLFAAGADIITTGNHVFRQWKIREVLDGAESLLRPANFPGHLPGKGTTVQTFSGLKVLVVNLLGTIFMEPMASPFETMEKILKIEEGKYDLVFCDLHAEATGEKIAFARHFDGRLTAVFGTHTHVPTADATVLPGGTGYITDLGMCGGEASVLGMDPDFAIRRFLDRVPTPFTPAKGPVAAHGVLFEVDVETGRCLSVTPVHFAE